MILQDIAVSNFFNMTKGIFLPENMVFNINFVVTMQSALTSKYNLSLSSYKSVYISYSETY